MKNIILILTLALITFSFSKGQADEIDDLFSETENTEFEFDRFSENNVMDAIAHDAGIACKKGMCTLSSTSKKYKEITFNLNGGIGNNASSGFGGYGSGNGGTNINFNNNAGNTDVTDRFHAGINIQFKVGTCEKSAKVPRSLYYAMNRYLYGLLNEDGSTRRAFTPADEGMILFYTTVAKSAEGC